MTLNDYFSLFRDQQAINWADRVDLQEARGLLAPAPVILLLLLNLLTLTTLNALKTRALLLSLFRN